MAHHNTPTKQAMPLGRDVLVAGGVIVVGTIMAILDATIVNVAIPTLGREFRASISTIQWTMTAYLLALASVIPLSGWASGRFGAKRVWIASLLVFMAGSALAGAAWSIESLIGFRVLQGAGAGLLMPVGQTILAQAAGPERMGRVMSIVGVPMLLGPIFGPVAGGALIGHASWRWIFFVNLPVGAAAVALAWRLLPAGAARRGNGLDVRGLALLSPGIALFVYGVSEAGASGGLGGARTLAGIAGGVLLVALFALHSIRRGPEALLDLSLLRRRGFAAAAGTSLLIGIALFGALILLPLYFQLVRGESALATGLLLAPQGLGAAIAMPLAGRLTDAIGARTVIPAGIGLALAGIAAYAQAGAETSYAFLAGALFVVGLGLGSTVVPSMAVAYQSVPREAVAHATSMINVIQRIAGSVGAALLAIVLERSLAGALPGAEGGIAGLAGLSGGERTAIAPALAGGFDTTFWVAFGLTAAALVPALLLPRARPSQASRAGADATAERTAPTDRTTEPRPAPPRGVVPHHTTTEGARHVA